MRKASIRPLLLVPIAITIVANWSYAEISVYITPGSSQEAVFQISGDFDGPVNFQGALSAFTFATSDMWAWQPGAFASFVSPPAMIINQTRGLSADIGRVGAYNGYMEFDFVGTLLVQPGDTVSLFNYGPAASLFSFDDFVPGTYVFNNANLGPTRFQVEVVPEPHSLALLGFCCVSLLRLRRR